MAITVLKMDGTNEIIEAAPGTTCRDALIEKGIYTGPPDSIKVTCDGQDVSDEMLSLFDGKKVTIGPKEAKGGRV